jgi:hypothetical protein
MSKFRPQAVLVALVLATAVVPQQPTARAQTQPAAGAQSTCVSRPYRAYLAQVLLLGAPPPAPGELTDNGFDFTPRVWSVASENGFGGIYNSTSADWQRLTKGLIAPRSVPNALLFPSCSGLDEFASVSQTFVVPADAQVLSYHSIGLSTEFGDPGGVCPNSPDKGEVRINGRRVDLVPLCERLDANGDPLPIAWERRTVTVTSYAGQTVTLAFAFQSDDQDGSAWLVDDVAISP